MKENIKIGIIGLGQRGDVMLENPIIPMMKNCAGIEIAAVCDLLPDRVTAAAEISWTAKEEKDYKDFEERVEKLRNPLKALGIKTAPHEFYSGRAYTDNPNGHISEIWDLWHADPDFEMKCLKK